MHFSRFKRRDILCMMGFMNHFTSFRKALVAHIAASLGVLLVLASLGAGCGAKVIVDEDLGSGGAGGTTGQQSSSASTGILACDPLQGVLQEFIACFKPPADGVCLDKAAVAGPFAASLSTCMCFLSVDTGPNPGPTGDDTCCYTGTIGMFCI